VKDINEVLNRKKAQLEVLGKQISQLQAAAEELRSIAHLLQDDDQEQGHAAGR
jgi:prefoldin subunit 5